MSLVERHIMASGAVLRTHDASQCGAGTCCLHSPSDHALKDAPLNWRPDLPLMERVCEHGIGHPDPDDLAYRATLGADVESLGVHGCDGCCA